MYKKIDTLIDKRNGYLLTKDVVKSDIHREYMRTYIKDNNIKKVSQGIYARDDLFIDELYVLSLKNQKIIFSHETALDLHGLMEREPHHINCTVVFGYNASHLSNKGIRIYTSVKKYYSIGKTKVKTIYGNIVPVYDMEKTICDIIKNKESMDVQVFSYALKEYSNNPKKNLHNLIIYSKIMNIENKVRNYLEVI